MQQDSEKYIANDAKANIFHIESNIEIYQLTSDKLGTEIDNKVG